MRVSTGRSNISTLAAVLASDWTIQVPLKIVLQKKGTVENEKVWYSEWGPVVRKMVRLHVAKISVSRSFNSIDYEISIFQNIINLCVK
jgi:hypothetical protein